MFWPILFLALGVLAAGGLCRACSDCGGYRPVEGWYRLPDGVPSGGVMGIATDSADNVYLLNGGDLPEVFCLSPQGSFVRRFGRGQIEGGHGLRIEAGRLFATDVKRHQVLEFTLDGREVRAMGQRGVPGLGPDQFNKPTDIALSPAGEMYVTDGYGNSRVVKLSADGAYILEWGRKGTEPGEFDAPHNIRLDADGRVYVADRENRRVQVFTAEGRFLTQWPHVGRAFGLYITPDQRAFVTDGGGAERVLEMALDGTVLACWGSAGEGPGQFRVAHSVCVDSVGDLYVSEVDGKRVQKFTRG